MSKKTSSPGKIHLRIIEVMKRFPDGITARQIRQNSSEKAFGRKTKPILIEEREI
jgi:hypothetical protein